MSGPPATTRWIVWIVYVTLLITTACPFTIYYAYRYYILRLHPVIVKRYPPLTFFLNVLLLAYLIVDLPLQLGSGFHLFLRSDLQRSLVLLIDIVVLHGVFAAALFRAWMIFFDIRWSKSMEQRKWKQLITGEDTDPTWFLKNHHRFGNFYYMIRLFPFFYLFSVAVSSSILLGMGIRMWQLLNGMQILIYTILLAALYYKLPPYHDKFRIRHELRIVVIASSVGVLGYAVLSFAARPLGYFWEAVMLIMLLGFLVPVVVCTSTFWVLNRSGVVTSEFEGVPLTKLFNQTTLDTLPALETNVSTNNVRRIKLQDCIRTADGFRAFMNHLFSEFSPENLLCVVEMLQFRESLLPPQESDEDGNEPMPESDFQYDHILPSFVPKSAIVNDTQLSLHDKAMKLCEKYVLSSAEFMVNIAHKTRQELLSHYHKQFKDSTEEDMKEVFVPTIIALFKLMKDSYQRFVESPEFTRLGLDKLEKVEDNSPET